MPTHFFRTSSLLFLGALIACQASHSDELPKAEFALLESEPQTGSIIRKNVAWGSAIPINRTYEQLTPDERARVHALYQRIEPGDEPPFPSNGLKPVLLAISKGQSKVLAKGKLTLVADVDSTGTVKKVEIYDNPDPDLVKFAASVLLMTKFKPALCKGNPCSMQYPFSFQLSVQ
jgi:hypothetical protein